jgi:hypothetical protein
MKKFIGYILEGLVILILIGVIVYQAKQVEYLKLAFAPYTVGNFKNYRRLVLTELMPQYNEVANKWRVSAYTIAAIGIKENLNDLYSHGVKKIPESAIKENPRQWQSEACAKIVSEVMLEYVYCDDKRLMEFYEKLGKRYCEWDKGYGKEIYAIHKQIEKGDIKK